MQLNKQQLDIVAHNHGAALVLAGAGSGKTRVIVNRVARLIEEGQPPESIMMLTFTNKAAKEMGQRVTDLINDASYANKILKGTFHSIANRFLRRYADLVGYATNYTIIDDKDRTDLIRQAVANCSFNSKELPKNRLIGSVFSQATCFNSTDIAAIINDHFTQLDGLINPLTLIYEEFLKLKINNNYMDFDDLLLNWYRLLKEHPQINILTQIEYVLVDEYQDTNHIQEKIINELYKATPNVMAVGDDDQTIYSWRGSDVRNILSFDQRYAATIYPLTINYRSSPQIISVAAASIAHNQGRLPKNLSANNEPLENTPEIFKVSDSTFEARLLSKRIAYHNRCGVPLDKMCVLYRNHRHSMSVQFELTQQQIPFNINSGLRFSEQAHIKDILAFLRVVYNPLDEVAWKRILLMVSGIGAKKVQQIIDIFAEAGGVHLGAENETLQKAIPKRSRDEWHNLTATFSEILEETSHPAQLSIAWEGFYHEKMALLYDNYKERRADIEALLDLAAGFEDLEEFLSQMSLLENSSGNEGHQEQVCLSTIHKAKGLEWHVVFMIGLCEGMLPSELSVYDEMKIEEERRLFYVGVTRAQQALEIFVPRMAGLNNRRTLARESRFLREVPRNLVKINNDMYAFAMDRVHNNRKILY